MAARFIKTRIQNKIDTLANWEAESPTLLAGELAIVLKPTDQDSPDNLPWPYSIKVGDGQTPFNELAWLSADANVPSWAECEKAEDIRVAIITGDSESEVKTLKEWLEAINTVQASHDAAIALNTEKLNGYTAEAIKQLIEEKLANLDFDMPFDVEITGTEGIVKDVTKNGSKLAITKGLLIEDDLPDIHANKIVITDDNSGTQDVNEKITLDAKLANLSSEISDINATILGGVHFIGIVTFPADLSQNTSEQTIILDDNATHTAVAGDLVIQGEKEFVWSGSVWKELGDLSRVGKLEAKVNSLDYDDYEVTGKYITQVSQTDGKISVSRAQPVSADIKHGVSSTVHAELLSHVTRLNAIDSKLEGITSVSTSIAASISDTINSLDAADPVVTGNSTTFIDSVKQENGRLIATKATIQAATAESAGVVKLNDSVDSDVATEAATASAVKKTNDVITAIAQDYVRYNVTDSKLYVGKIDQDEIIFDCGGVPD
jgi:PBP1b-binding outer membrane lipoprotein LpoB